MRRMRESILPSLAAAVAVAVALAPGRANAEPATFCGATVDATTTKIECEDKAVSDLSPLAGATALEELDLRMTAVTDLAPLAKLTRLRDLDIRGTGVRDLKPLAGLPLVVLNLSGTPVTDLTPLAKVLTLIELDASDTAVKKIRALAKHANLDQVDLRRTKVSRADAKWLGKRARHVYWGADGEGHYGTATTGR
jgi:Leucine-rich repeat (LRR) protein